MSPTVVIAGVSPPTICAQVACRLAPSAGWLARFAPCQVAGGAIGLSLPAMIDSWISTLPSPGVIKMPLPWLSIVTLRNTADEIASCISGPVLLMNVLFHTSTVPSYTKSAEAGLLVATLSVKSVPLTSTSQTSWQCTAASPFALLPTNWLSRMVSVTPSAKSAPPAKPLVSKTLKRTRSTVRVLAPPA